MTTTPALGADKATDERALFESESLRLDIIDDEGFERYDSGDYVDEPSHVAWRAWQARAALAAVPASEPVGQCRWPNCESEATQQAIAEEVAESLFGVAAPAPVSGMPDLASLQRWEFETYDQGGNWIEPNITGEYVRLADVERLLNPTGATR